MGHKEVVMWITLKRYSDYEINESGDVRRKDSKEVRKPYLVNGHPKINLCGRTEYIGRLVAETYIPNPEGKTDVRHINGDKADNDICNLEWSSHSQTQKDSYGLGVNAPGGNCGPKPVRILETGDLYSSVNACAKALNGTASGVRQCANGKIKTYKGFHIIFER